MSEPDPWPPDPARRYVGIDPGSKGAIAVVNSHGKILGAMDIPGDDETGLFNGWAHLLWEVCRYRVGEEWVAAVEDPVAVPKESTASAQKLGISMGLLRMLMISSGFPVRRVSPQMWKRKVFFGTNYAGGPLDKRAAKSLASDILGYPLGRADRADAFLIARWLWAVDAESKSKR